MNDKQKEAYDILAKKMDLDYAYKVKLKEWYLKHGEIPEGNQHKETFEAFQKDRFKCWREMPKVVKRIKRAAKKAAKAKGLERLTEEANRG
jgi:hypothetical protein